jgi:hypothetical protein
MKVQNTSRAKRLLVVCVVAVIVIQFLGPARTNPPVVASHTIGSRVQIPPRIADIMDRACMDCHSHETRWPWYSRVAPVRWWLVQNVNDGRNTLDLSEWTQYRPTYAGATLGSMALATKSGLMPPAAYRALHPSVRLSAEEIKEFSDWAEAERLRIWNGLVDSNKTKKQP